MDSLRSLYDKIPEKLRKPVVHWVLPFLFGLIITLIWDVGTLLIILFLLFIVFFIISELGNKDARAAGKWSINQYFKRIRGMIIFALLPAAWELIKEHSLDSIIGLVILIFLALSIWNRFDEIMKDFTKKFFRKQRRRRR